MLMYMTSLSVGAPLHLSCFLWKKKNTVRVTVGQKFAFSKSGKIRNVVQRTLPISARLHKLEPCPRIVSPTPSCKFSKHWPTEFGVTRSILMRSIATRSTPMRSTCREINSHEINLSQDQLNVLMFYFMGQEHPWANTKTFWPC